MRDPPARTDRGLPVAFLLHPGDRRPPQCAVEGTAGGRLARRPGDAPGLEGAPRDCAPDPGICFRESQAARQQELRCLRRPQPAVRGVERVRRAGVLGRAQARMLSLHRLCQLPRLLFGGRRAAARGEAADRGLRCPHRRGAGLLDARLVRRSAAFHLHPLPRRAARAPRVPRARAPARVREERHHLQRVLRRRGRGGGRASAGCRPRGAPASSPRSRPGRRASASLRSASARPASASRSSTA